MIDSKQANELLDLAKSAGTMYINANGKVYKAGKYAANSGVEYFSDSTKLTGLSGANVESLVNGLLTRSEGIVDPDRVHVRLETEDGAFTVTLVALRG